MSAGSDYSGFLLCFKQFHHAPTSPPTPPLAHLHLVCSAALAICTCLDSNYGVVKAFLPVACKFLLSHTLKSRESHLNGVHVSLLFASVVVVINLFSMPYALHINKQNRVCDCNAKYLFLIQRWGRHLSSKPTTTTRPERAKK